MISQTFVLGQTNCANKFFSTISIVSPLFIPNMIFAIKKLDIIAITHPLWMISFTDYDRPVRKLPSLHSQKSNPNPKLLGTAEAYFVCRIGPNFHISLIYAFTGCPQSVISSILTNITDFQFQGFGKGNRFIFVIFSTKQQVSILFCPQSGITMQQR